MTSDGNFDAKNEEKFIIIFKFNEQCIILYKINNTKNKHIKNNSKKRLD